MKSPFGNQSWYASTLHKQTILTKEGRKTKNKVSYDPNNNRVYAFYGKRAHTVKYISENVWEEID